MEMEEVVKGFLLELYIYMTKCSVVNWEFGGNINKRIFYIKTNFTML